MRLVVAPDKFAGSLSAADVCTEFGAGWRDVREDDDVRFCPMADGGEGTVATVAAARGIAPQRARVHDPLYRVVDAPWLLLDDGTALIECAQASGLCRIGPDERDPLVATSYGTGELVLAALDAGAQRIVIGLGGSATNDGGAGLAQALGLALLDLDGATLARGGLALGQLDRVDASRLDPRLAGVRVLLASDVDNPLCGPNGASAVFGPQKGADADAVQRLDASLRRWADVLGRDVPGAAGVADRPGAGAAGGLGAALLALAGAEMRPGVDVVAELVGLDAALDIADVVVTGEGALDWQTLRGKAPAGVAARAQARGLPCLAVAGRVDLGRRELAAAGFDAAYALTDLAPSVESAMTDAARWVREAGRHAARQWHPVPPS